MRSGSVHISVLDGALWYALQVRWGMGEIGLLLLLFYRSAQIVVWYLWYWYLQYLTLNELTCFAGPAVRLLDDPQCAVRSGSVDISVLDGALWDALQVRCGMGEIGLLLSLFNRSVQIVVWYLWYWDLFYVILVCIRFHVIFVSCDCIMKCTWTFQRDIHRSIYPVSSSDKTIRWYFLKQLYWRISHNTTLGNIWHIYWRLVC